MGSSIRRYLHFVRPYRRRMILTIFIGIIKFGIPLLLPLLLKYVVDDLLLTSLPLTTKLSRLTVVIGAALFVFVVVRIPVEYFRHYFAQLTAYQVLYDMRNRLFDHMQKLSLRYYHQNRVGQIVSRVINDVEQTKDFIITGMMNIWLDLVTLLIAVAIMCWMNPLMALLAMAVFPLYAICVKYFFSNVKYHTKQRSQALAELQGHLHERTEGMPLIRSFHLEEEEQQQFQQRNRQFLQKAVTQSRWMAKAFAAISTITDIGPILVIAASSYLVLQGKMTIGEMTAFYGYMSLVYSPVRRLVNASTTLTQAHASIDRVFEFFDEPYDIQDKPDAKEIDEVKGEISFQNVSFRYYDDQDWILRNVEVTIHPGQTVAIVGPSGGGKTTLLSLLPRFYDVTEGRVLLDGLDIRSIKLQSLRRQLGFVLQDQILFSGTVEENLRMGKVDATMDEIVEAAKMANAHSFIQQLPNGYQTEIGERGVKLSGGQKQRLSLARVFLKDPSVLVLDEATSHLDLKSEHLIQESLERLKKGRTTIVIAHRLSTITHADQIIYIDRGEVKEQGTHQELMEQNGMYAQLFRVQHLNASPEGYR